MILNVSPGPSHAISHTNHAIPQSTNNDNNEIYQCPDCDKQYNDRTSFVTHRNKVHKIQLG